MAKIIKVNDTYLVLYGNNQFAEFVGQGADEDARKFLASL